MEWLICLILAAVLFVGAAVLAYIKAKTRYKRGQLLDPLKILFLGVILAAVAMFIPVYINTFKTTHCGVVETFLLSVHNVIRLFVVDGEFKFITDNLVGVSDQVYTGYTILFAVLFVTAPVLTFGFVMSFFKNASAYWRYISHHKTDAFIFSELNEKALAAVESLQSKNRLFIFTDVSEDDSEQVHELAEQAKELGAICFKKDIVALDFSFHSKNSSIHFFTISEDPSRNVEQALQLLESFKYRDRTNLYVFSTQPESEMLLANAFDSEKNPNRPIKIKVRRVNEVRSLIFRTLYEDGYQNIFESALDDGTGEKKINAVVIGMGQHGTEMTKALAWVCQMDGYAVQIDSFDVAKNAEEKFKFACPELMAFSGKLDIPGESRYTIHIHPDTDVDTQAFEKILADLPETTYVFVALGNDERNIAVAINLRTRFERMGRKPVIQAVVYNTNKKEALAGITNYRGQSYKIDFIGDRKSTYSEKVLLNSDVEAVALSRHMQWGSEADFWKYDYNYKSSVASAIHRELKRQCGIPGIDKKPADRTEEELWNIRILEHRRWNAYMRAEGYVYSGDLDSSSRNDLAKKHHCLVAFDRLSEKDKAKDDD